MFLNFINCYLNKGPERSVRTRKNILAMLAIKGGSVLCGFLLVPLTLGYVDSESYGIWLTLSSMVAWISFFDIGINNGLKNYLTKVFADRDYTLGKKLVSTTYAILSLIFIPLMIFLLILAPIIDWQSILNIQIDKIELTSAILIIIAYFCLNFVLSTINIVLLSDQRPADESLRQLAQQVFSLLLILLLTKFTDGTLVNLCMALCAAPLLVVTFFNFTLFRGRYKNIRPDIKEVDFNLLPILLKPGMQFFIIQIAYVVLFQMTNFLIIRYFGAEEVTGYNISFKFFSIMTMVWGILTTPIWTAVADAMAKKDNEWIKKMVSTYLKLFGLMVLLSLIMLAFSSSVYHLWVGNQIDIPFVVSLWVMLLNIGTMFGSIFVYVLNGAGIIKVQAISSLISPFVFIASFFFLKRCGIGVSSVLIASIIANFNGLILAPIQYYTHFTISKP